jgi:hypothetical protein
LPAPQLDAEVLDAAVELMSAYIVTLQPLLSSFAKD